MVGNGGANEQCGIDQNVVKNMSCTMENLKTSNMSNRGTIYNQWNSRVKTYIEEWKQSAGEQGCREMRVRERTKTKVMRA